MAPHTRARSGAHDFATESLPSPRPRRSAPTTSTDGRFTSTAVAAPIPELSLREGLRLRARPYYLTALQQGQDRMLPMLRRIMDLSPEEYSERLWDPALQDDGIPALLDSIGAVLEDNARRETSIDDLSGALVHTLLPGHDAFARPLAPLLTTCMLVDSQKVADAEHMWAGTGGYLVMYLGKDATLGGRRFLETAHRIIIWCTHGPPPNGMKRPVVMHVCNNPACIHPEHLVWGEDEENFSRQAHTHALERRMQQRRW